MVNQTNSSDHFYDFNLNSTLMSSWTNSSNSINNKTIIIIQHILITLIGTTGNTLVIIVYRYKFQSKDTIIFFIVHLAIVDLVCCTILVPLNCYMEYHSNYVTNDFICKLSTFLNIFNITYSCFIMTLIAVERFCSIMYPFIKIFNKKRAFIIICFLSLICFIFAVLGGCGVGVYHWQIAFINNKTIGLDNTTVDIHKQEIGSYLNQARNDSPILSHIVNSPHHWHFTKTNECFPNNVILNKEYLSYLRTIQNTLIVFCFVVIFGLYAIVFIYVMKRRRMRRNRRENQRKIIYRSTVNGLLHHHHHHHHHNSSKFDKKNKQQDTAQNTLHNSILLTSIQTAEPHNNNLTEGGIIQIIDPSIDEVNVNVNVDADADAGADVDDEFGFDNKLLHNLLYDKEESQKIE
jgi:hypothetical protein